MRHAIFRSLITRVSLCFPRTPLMCQYTPARWFYGHGSGPQRHNGKKIQCCGQRCGQKTIAINQLASGHNATTADLPSYACVRARMHTRYSSLSLYRCTVVDREKERKNRALATTQPTTLKIAAVVGCLKYLNCFGFYPQHPKIGGIYG